MDISLEQVINYVDLPNQDQFDEQVSKVVVTIGGLPRRWGFPLSNVISCLCSKNESVDQANEFEIQVFNALVNGRNIDFACMIFEELKAVATKSPRGYNVAYIRFMS